MTRADVRYSCRLLRAGRLMLDGGSMFGVVPQVVWSRDVPLHEHNQIELSHNCLLLEGPPDEPGGRNRLVVIETGTGNKLPDKMKKIFGLEDRWVRTALREAGCDEADVADVVVSHLHFDHAGGLTRLPEPGEKPDWSGDDRGGGGGAGVKLTFPNARVHVQQREWDDALANRAVMTKTYYNDHLEPIAERVRTVDSPRPFPIPGVVQRDEVPRTTVAMRETEILPGIGVFLVPGHTWGQQCVKFTDPERGVVVFTPDVMPTHWHAGAAYSLAYDVEPYTSMLSKHWLLAEAAGQGWTLLLDHEPGEAFYRVQEDGRGWYRLEPA